MSDSDVAQAARGGDALPSDRPVDDGGPAFPNSTATTMGDEGMTLRDWFAGQALAGVLASLAGSKGEIPHLEKALAESAYDYADAMLAARKEKP